MKETLLHIALFVAGMTTMRSLQFIALALKVRIMIKSIARKLAADQAKENPK